MQMRYSNKTPDAIFRIYMSGITNTREKNKRFRSKIPFAWVVLGRC